MNFLTRKVSFMRSMFLIWSYDIKDKGQEQDVKKWIIDNLHPYLRKIPYFRSIRTYMRRLGLGREPILQTWIEISSFSVLDKWAHHIQTEEWKEISTIFFSLTKAFNSTIVYELV